MLINAQNLIVEFKKQKGLLFKNSTVFRALDQVSFNMSPGEKVALVGESGSGKSTLGNCLMGLTPIHSGQLQILDQNIDIQNPKSWQPFRKQIQMIFQDFNNSLNPRHSLFEILKSPLLYHKICTEEKTLEIIEKVLTQVKLPLDSLYRFPHQFSGGQRQRINLARALLLQPKLLICDEVASALDVSVQAQIIELLEELHQEHKIALLFITHDLAIAKHLCSRICVMNQGKIVEEAPSQILFENPQEDYTKKLLSAIPTLDLSLRKKRIHCKSDSI